MSMARRAAALCGVGLLAGCLALPEGATRSAGFNLRAPDVVSVARGAVQIGGPHGYCVDKPGSTLRGDTAFVLLASCYSITRDPQADAPSVPAILTASVAEQTDAAPATEAALDQLAAFFSSASGRATLARDGRAGSVEVIDTRRIAGAVLLQLRDSSTNTTPGLAETYWRGFFDQGGRLITISVLGFAGQPIAGDDGFTTLRLFLARIRQENEVLVPASPAPASAKPRKRLFANLFN